MPQQNNFISILNKCHETNYASTTICAHVTALIVIDSLGRTSTHVLLCHLFIVIICICTYTAAYDIKPTLQCVYPLKLFQPHLTQSQKQVFSDIALYALSAIHCDYTPRKLCFWWVYCFYVVHPCVRPSVCACLRNVLFQYLKESLLDFHQTLQTCSYMQDKYFRQKVRARGQLYLYICMKEFGLEKIVFDKMTAVRT